MTDSDLIDIALWDKAGWRGMVFRVMPGTLPVLALMFDNQSAAEEIFSRWRKRIGEVDRFEIIRVSIIEGEIPGLDSGYSVHIGSNVDGVIASLTAAGKPPTEKVMMNASRIQRMQGAASSPYLKAFKEAIAAVPEYWLTAAAIGNGELLLDHQHRIKKTKVVVRRVEDIRKDNDMDYVVIQAGQPRRPTRIH